VKTLLAAFVLLAPTAQPGAPPPCINLVEVEHATLFLLPPVLDGLTEQCRAHLPASAYMLNGGAATSKRLTAERDVHWASAKAVMMRFGGDSQAAMLSADTAGSFIRDMIRSEGGKAITAEHCATMDRALALLAPLPPENMAALVSLAVETGLRSDAGKAKAAALKPVKPGKESKGASPVPIICPAPAASGGQ
jgi:hypothetical protein